MRSTFISVVAGLASFVALATPAHAGSAVHLGSFEQGGTVSIDVSAVQCDAQGGIVEYSDSAMSFQMQIGFMDGTDTSVGIDTSTLSLDTHYVWVYCGSLAGAGPSRLPHGITLASADYTFAVIAPVVVDTTPQTVLDTTPQTVVDTTPVDTTPVDCTDTGVVPDTVVADTSPALTEAPRATDPQGPSRRPHAALCPPEVVADNDTNAGSGTGQEAESGAAAELPPTGAGWSVLAMLGLGLGGIGIVATRMRRRSA